MNKFGKALVLVYSAFAMLFMSWSVMMYLQFNDYGWKDPFKVWETKDTGYRIASHLDKRTAFLYELYRQKERAIPGIKPALDTLTETMEFFPKNHQFYVTELEKIREGVDIKAVQPIWKDGDLVLDTGNKPLGKPKLVPAGGVDKSTKETRKELMKILSDIEAITPEIKALIKDADDITIQLYGTKDDKGNSLDIGLYEVLDLEKTHQDKIRDEKEYLTPRYVDAQRRFESFRDRFGSMLKTGTPVNMQK